MYYDALTAAAVRDELAARAAGGRVQRVVQVGRLEAGLEIYAGMRLQLLLSAEPRQATVRLVDEKLRRGVETVTPFHLLLTKYVRGARLQDVTQPPLERILHLTFAGAEGVATLVCEIMGRYSNLILVDPDGMIMEAIKRVPASVNRYRTILPAEAYVPPPPQEKESPFLLTAQALAEAVAAEPKEPVWRALVATARGVSPLLAREVVARALGDPAAARPLTRQDSVALVDVLGNLMRLPETHAWDPCVAYQGEERHPAAYAPYALTHWDDVTSVASISAAIDAVASAKKSFDAYQRVRQRLYDLIGGQIERQEARLRSLRGGMVSEEELETLVAQGNAILALAWRIKPGQQELIIDPAELGLDPGFPADRRVLHLDPSLSAAENAQALFAEYRRLKAARAQLPQLIAQAERELDYLEQLRAEAQMAENRPQLDAVETALEEAGLAPRRPRPKRVARGSQPLRIEAEDGTLILVGRNSRENDEVTFRLGGPDDIWLHAHGVPGAHVVIKSGGADVAPETFRLAGQLAAYYATSRDNARVQVDYTQRRHVRHIKGAHPGMVTYTHEETKVVPGTAPELPDGR
jgi:predicted ribosome quality control (RQC) complex YloA/Tae2 family protein